MKVHPAMLMKTKERGKVLVPNVRKDASRPEVQSLRRAGRVMILTSNSSLLAPVSKMKVHPAISMKTKEDDNLSCIRPEVSEQSSAYNLRGQPLCSAKQKGLDMSDGNPKNWI